MPASSGLDWNYVPVFDTTTASQNCSTHFYCTWDATVARSWSTNRAFFGTQLYHFLNVYHDHLLAAPIGFTEAAGNFQATNSTGQGLGGDAVQGQAIDGANTDHGFPDANHLNNANMSTLPDGEPPVMQMYLQQQGVLRAPHPERRLGHRVRDRLPRVHARALQPARHHAGRHPGAQLAAVGRDGRGVERLVRGRLHRQPGLLRGRPLGERRRDRLPLLGGRRPGLPDAGDRLPGRGLRHELQAVPQSGTAGTGGYTYGDFGKVYGVPEVHGDGEIWSQTLWDIRTALGSAVSESIITRGMELSPPNPSFLDMRNAIIQADVVAFGGSHVSQLWTAFAHRGMGFFAVTIDGDDTSPIEDFSTPVDCAMTTCGSIAGTVTDSETGDPIGGVPVYVAGQNSGFTTDLAAVTDATGAFSIANVPFHAYPRIVAGGTEYEAFATQLTVNGAETLDISLVRDWASLSGGAHLGHFTPPDYSPFCGTAADGAFDGLVATGWPSDAPGNGDSGVTGPRSAVVKLPQAVDITSFAVASGGTCGDGPDSAVKKFRIETKTSGGQWVTALTAKAKADSRLHVFTTNHGVSNVRMIRFVMLTTHGNTDFMDVLEVSVRGTA